MFFFIIMRFMQKYKAEHTHKYTNHIAGKVPPFGRPVGKYFPLQQFNATAQCCGNEDDLKDRQRSEAIIVGIIYSSVKQQDRQDKEKPKMYHLVKSFKKKACPII